MSNQADQDTPTPGEAHTLSLAHAAGYGTFTLDDLRRNRKRAVASALLRAERANKEGDADRNALYLELAAALEVDGIHL